MSVGEPTLEERLATLEREFHALKRHVLAHLPMRPHCPKCRATVGRHALQCGHCGFQLRTEGNPGDGLPR